MIIGISGSLCAGKASVAAWLVAAEGFQPLRILRDGTKSGAENGDDATGDDGPVPPRMTADECLRFVMAGQRWRQNWVVWPVETRDQLDAFRRRPFFLWLAVDAPLLLRHRRFVDRRRDSAGTADAADLEHFVRMDDEAVTGITRWSPAGLCGQQPDVLVINGYETQADLSAYLSSHFVPPLTSPERLRPSWDDYFMLLADLAARRSNCMKRRVGCILVKRGRVLATGYNGTPRGVRNCSDGGCDRCNRGEARCGEGLSECLCLHAEENALLEAGRERIDNDEAVLYCNTCPCLSCAKKIIQSGVREVVYRQEYGMDTLTARLFGEAQVRLRRHRPLLQMQISSADNFSPPLNVAENLIETGGVLK